jgi:hypothetical protein
VIKVYVIEKGVNWFLRKINCIIIELIQKDVSLGSFFGLIQFIVTQ